MSSEYQLAVLPSCALARKIEPTVWSALTEIYEGCTPEKVAILHDYCVARKLDPLKKPMHIVKVWSKAKGTMVETIWPSIAETRITAMRTGVFAGQDDTKWGPTLTQQVGAAQNFSFPEWAQITVFRLVAGQRCAFPGPRVYFLEAYSPAKTSDPTPNSMWTKRTWGQLEKCAEAAALRRAFPEEAGGQLTAEEVKTFDDDAEPVNVTGTATTAPAGDAPAKRAPVPRKKGAAAMDAAPAPAPEPAQPTEPVIEVASEVVAEPAPPPPAPEPTPEPAKPSIAQVLSSETVPAWPQTVQARVVKGVDAKAKNPDGTTKPVRVVELVGGNIVIEGETTEVARAGRFIMDPSRPELAKFGAVSDDMIDFSVTREKSQSDPTKYNLIIIRATLADVAM
jgi:phage recombination protein Bet